MASCELRDPAREAGSRFAVHWLKDGLSLVRAAFVVAVSVGIRRLRGAAEGGQRVNCAAYDFYLAGRQFAGSDALQDSIILFHRWHPFYSVGGVQPRRLNLP
jgi:hypothetical protein